ncbi:DNA-protecting protein DprA (plasmid) [Pseudorhodobacter turbinis]|uniref:DNA-protecting protein DprA n=1 Tax=Pseudorhodobacter turbinis TaxID=2500533 RepID=A0A4P8EIJ3_9RHOB|nr:DNA-processing protein DprA [Pseudorhodobacter turbinis]QCO56652.1 DNA-protecting protein DprA [Pseudorhodobacter turbinis]
MYSDLSDNAQPTAPDLTGPERLDWLRLIRSRRVGPVTFHGLIDEHGSAAAALQALPEIAAAAGVEKYTICPVEVAQHEMTLGRKAGAQMICWGEAAYPQALYDLNDAPPVLWVMGDASLLNRPGVALVGARNASSLGVRMATRLAETLGERGFVTISGLARGIDAAAHKAALTLGTIAVQAGGVDVIYPEENTQLAIDIAEKGCRVSEQPMGTAPQARHFPLRNRLVSGLSRAVVVVEAAVRSGSLITARNALDQGRDVLAVPGHPFDARAAGCNLLIREGALLVRSSSDVIEAIGTGVPLTARVVKPAVQSVPKPSPLPGPVPNHRPLSEVSALHSQILARLGPSPLAEDQLIRDLAMPSARITPELLTLELDGKVMRQAGGLLSRVE